MTTNKQYRAYNISHKKSKDVIHKLEKNGIINTEYRINYFSGSKEIVAEKNIIERIKKIV